MCIFFLLWFGWSCLLSVRLAFGKWNVLLTCWCPRCRVRLATATGDLHCRDSWDAFDLQVNLFAESLRSMGGQWHGRSQRLRKDCLGEADFVINRFCIWLVFLAHTTKQSMKGCKARGNDRRSPRLSTSWFAHLIGAFPVGSENSLP